MRTILGLALAGSVAFLIPSAVRADDRETALEVIEKAIKAHGGEEVLGKAVHQTRSAKGTVQLGGKDVSFTAEVVVSLPERQRIVFDFDKRLQITTVVNGDKGWSLQGGAAAELGKERLEEVRDELYVWWLATLVPLKKGSFELTPLAEIKVNDQPAVGVKVSSKDRKDVKLYFDKNSNLLVKIERRARETGVALDKEYVFSNFKEFDGVKMATLEITSTNGRKSQEVTLTSFKILTKPDDKAFEKP
jgi:hypothetical protein